MKDNLPFFSHDNNARNHPKMKALIAEFGYEGYGRFWALNERIAESAGAFIDISRKVYKLDLAKELGLDGDGLDKFLAFLSDPDIDLINLQNGIITTDRITELFTHTMENRKEARDKKRNKKGKDDFPEEKDDFPEGIQEENEDLPEENDTYKTRLDNTKQDDIRQDNKFTPTACAIDHEKAYVFQKTPKQTEIMPISQSPPESAETKIAVSKQKRASAKKLELDGYQLNLFNAAKACFDISEKSKAMIYKSNQTAAMQMRILKEIVISCTKIEPDLTKDFLKNLLEHFKIMCNGKLQGKATFTPRSLATPWIWEMVIGTLPEADDELTEKIRASIKGMFQ